MKRFNLYFAVCFYCFYLTLSLLCGKALAQTENNENSEPPPLPPNPLEVTTPDPLVPNPPKKNRSLTPAQLQELELALDGLNAEAATMLAAGNTNAAFRIWYRELRLRRYFGPIAEVPALTRVGAIAWQQQQITPVQVIDARLKAIHQQYCTGTPVCELTLLQLLGTAFETVRSRDNAITVYQQILTDTRDRADKFAEESTLKIIGRLYLEKLDHVNAAPPYEALLEFAVQRGDRLQEIAYLEELAFIYTQAKNPEKAIATRQRLVNYYNTPQDLAKIPELKLAIASDYETLGQLQTAIDTYEETYQLAWVQQQFYVASSALDRIATLYRNADRFDAALEVYEALLVVDRRAYNLYGIMSTYDNIGQIHKQRNNYPEALRAFQNGLEIARQVKYKQMYFTQQIEQLNQRSRETP